MTPAAWRWLFRAGAVVLGAAIFFVCVQPVQTLRDANYPQVNEWFDAMNHFIAFGVWNLMYRFGFGGWPTAPRAGAALLFCAACELVQLFVPTRGFQVLDLTVNVLPVLLWEVPLFKRLWSGDGPVWRLLSPGAAVG